MKQLLKIVKKLYLYMSLYMGGVAYIFKIDILLYIKTIQYKVHVTHSLIYFLKLDNPNSTNILTNKLH